MYYKLLNMKRILFLFNLTLLFVVTSCVSLEQMTVTEVIDYSRFLKNGIYVTESNDVDFDYTPVGSVVSVTRGAIKNAWSYSVDTEKAFSDIGKKVKAAGADGLINMKISNSYINSFYYTTVTGMAIKRKNTSSKTNITFQEKIGEIDNISIEVLEAYNNGTKILTSSEMTKEQIKKASKRFFHNQQQVQFYTREGWKMKHAYAAIIDKQIIDYETNELIPLD